MSQPSKDKELKPDTDVVKSNSSSSSSPSEEEAKTCVDPLDYMALKAKEIVIDKGKKTVTGAGKSSGKSHAGKRRKRAQGGLKKAISLMSGLNELGMTYDSDSEQVPKNADVAIKGKAKEEAEESETDVFQGSETESEKGCKRLKKGRNDDDDSDDSDGDEGGRGGVAHKNLTGGLGFELVTGK